jgi:hypothetical protein
MRGLAGMVAGVALAWLVLGSPPVVAQQISEAPVVKPTSATAGDELTVGQIEAELKAREADSGVEATLKEGLQVKLQQAIDLLKKADAHKMKGEIYHEAVKNGPAKAERLQAHLIDLPTAGTAD